MYTHKHTHSHTHTHTLMNTYTKTHAYTLMYTHKHTHSHTHTHTSRPSLSHMLSPSHTPSLPEVLSVQVIDEGRTCLCKLGLVGADWAGPGRWMLTRELWNPCRITWVISLSPRQACPAVQSQSLREIVFHIACGNYCHSAKVAKQSAHAEIHAHTHTRLYPWIGTH